MLTLLPRMELTRQAGNEPSLVGLMRVFKDYYPDVIVGDVITGRASVFTVSSYYLFLFSKIPAKYLFSIQIKNGVNDSVKYRRITFREIKMDYATNRAPSISIAMQPMGRGGPGHLYLKSTPSMPKK